MLTFTAHGDALQELNLLAFNFFLFYFKIFKYVYNLPKMGMIVATITTAFMELVIFSVMVRILPLLADEPSREAEHSWRGMCLLGCQHSLFTAAAGFASVATPGGGLKLCYFCPKQATIVLFGFCAAFYVCFGAYVAEFKSLGDSAGTLFRLVVGVFDYFVRIPGTERAPFLLPPPTALLLAASVILPF